MGWSEIEVDSGYTRCCHTVAIYNVMGLRLISGQNADVRRSFSFKNMACAVWKISPDVLGIAVHLNRQRCVRLLGRCSIGKLFGAKP
jgi:hypothetical protein